MLLTLVVQLCLLSGGGGVHADDEAPQSSDEKFVQFLLVRDLLHASAQIDVRMHATLSCVHVCLHICAF